MQYPEKKIENLHKIKEVKILVKIKEIPYIKNLNSTQ